jgi:starch-binding outer membrane protein, SusD/RagB family
MFHSNTSTASDMKKILKYSSAFVLSLFIISCHEVDVEVESQLTTNVFPNDSIHFIQASGPVYAALRGNFALDYWFMQTLSTDEAILPARGGNWYDNQGYRMLHYHDWTRDHGTTNSTWSWLSRIIGTCNQTLEILEESAPDTYSLKKANLAEIRLVRAMAYFMMLDLYGNVPIVTDFGDFNQKPNSSRKEVFDFIESEIESALPDLSAETGIKTYGRPTKHTANALLAKMYLNAEVYTGTARYNDCIAACDAVISSGKFQIEPRATYLQMFYPNNGPAMKEFIFAIPYDPTAGALPNTNGFMYHARYDVPRSLRAKFSLPFTPSAPESTLPEFYAHFNDENDIRNGQWLTGLQYMNDGVTPITVKTTKQGYDYTYTGDDAGASYTYHVELTPDIILRLNPALFDVGNDEIAWNMGYRNIKFYPDATSLNRNQNNDVPFLRYSDVILMKAEAILRGGTPTLGATAVSLVNDVRSNRTTSDALESVTLEEIYSERCREFAWEAWHRNDMIRFGKFEESWGFKTNSDPTRRLFPIPTEAFKFNTQLKQNDGY